MPSGRGRFAPSPTGDLHLGSLTTALASYLEARARGDEWLLRLEDIDQGRTLPGAAERIFSTLKSFGFQWPEPVLVQSNNLHAYENALDRLQVQGRLFACTCGRSDYQGIYSGHCRKSGQLEPGQVRPAAGVAIRLLTTGTGTIDWRDDWQGEQRQDVEREVGDFVLRRKDGFHAYQLAVVVDDAAQGITRVVRGADLLDNTPRQILLQRLLGVPSPTYAHGPLVLEADGSRLAKSRSSEAVSRLPPGEGLRLALRLLKQPPPPPRCESAREILAHGITHWNPAVLYKFLETRLDSQG